MHRPILAAACGLLAALGTTVCACGPEAASQGTPPPVPAAPAPLPKLRFVPEKSEHLDLAVGERRSFDLELVADGEVDWSALRVSTTCECLSAEFAGKAVAGKAPIRVTLHGLEPEDIDGGVVIEGPGHVRIVEHIARIAIRRGPFTDPREVAIAPTSEGRFELTVGQSFPLDAKLPDSILVDLSTDQLDTTKIDLIDMEDGKEHWPKHEPKSVVLTTKLAFVVVAEDKSLPFETTIPVEFGEPAVKRSVKVRWPGLPKAGH